MQHGNQLVEAALEIRRVLGHVGDPLQQGRGIAGRQRIQQFVYEAQVDAAQHTAHIGLGELAGAEGNGLVGETEGIAHTARRGPAQQVQGRFLEADHLLLEHVAQVADDLLRGHILEIELQAAGQDGHRQFLGVRGRQQELHVGRRLFQGLQQSIEAVGGQHMHLVDQVHLVTRPGGRILDVFQQLPGVLHLGARGRVHFQQVDAAPLGDLQAGRALAAGLRAHPGFAIEALGQDAGDGGLAHPACAGEQVGVVQAIVIQGIDQGLQYVLLADHFAEAFWSPLTRQHLVRHEGFCLGPIERADRIHQPGGDSKHSPLSPAPANRPNPGACR